MAQYWVVGKAIGLWQVAAIGPFNDVGAAAEHIVFCQERGDKANYTIKEECPDCGLYLTPEEDRDWTVIQKGKEVLVEVERDSYKPGHDSEIPF